MNMKSIRLRTHEVQAILEGRKTQTRRAVRPQPHEHHWEVLPGYKQGDNLLDTNKGLVASFYDYRGPGPHEQNGTSERNVQVKCPYGRPGDILYVRETWAVTCGGKYEYKADGGFPPRIIHESANESGGEDVVTERWFPSIHMPKEACRLFLRITDIRVERLQDITEDDAMAEGAEPMHHRCGGFGYYEAGGEIMECSCLSWNQGEYCMGFKLLWESINGPDSWQTNPFCWVLSFEKIEKPES